MPQVVGELLVHHVMELTLLYQVSHGILNLLMIGAHLVVMTTTIKKVHHQPDHSDPKMKAVEAVVEVEEALVVDAVVQEVTDQVAMNASSVMKLVTWLETALIRTLGIKVVEVGAVEPASDVTKRVTWLRTVPNQTQEVMAAEAEVEAEVVPVVEIGNATSVNKKAIMPETAQMINKKAKDLTRDTEERMVVLPGEMTTIMMAVIMIGTAVDKTIRDNTTRTHQQQVVVITGEQMTRMIIMLLLTTTPLIMQTPGIMLPIITIHKVQIMLLHGEFTDFIRWLLRNNNKNN